MGPTRKQVAGIVLVLTSALVSLLAESLPVLVCLGAVSLFGLLLIVRGGRIE